MFAENGSGKVGKKAYLEGAISTIPPLKAEECPFYVHFDWDIEDMGIPGAFTIKNHLLVEFFLVSFTLEDVPNCWYFKVVKGIVEGIEKMCR